MKKRKVELVILSDIHLGTYGCHARELLHYLKSIKPELLILNGDIIDIWQFRKKYFPAHHLKVLKKFINLASKGTKVYYITGNHDEMLRKFADFKMGNFVLTNKLMLNLNGQKTWIFHGDVFDASIQHSKWIAKLGGWGYDFLIVFNRYMNSVLEMFGREKYSLSKKIKNSVKKAVQYISNFEQTAAELAIQKGCHFVACGHIHQPQIREVVTDKGKTTYLNSGDWIENMSALEYHEGKWSVFHQPILKKDEPVEEEEENMQVEIDMKSIIHSMIHES
ncbi:MAG: UDP-2,3-diacylglucosamine diphosphatase [Flavobacteriaceae bacterium]|nr:UDP-2,3-diacylglucosamine diphosphatase [Flavobacteriaceae bacterium]